MVQGDGLTDRQLRVYRFVRDFPDRNGYYATVRDVQEFIGWRSPSTAHETLVALKRKGLVEKKRITRDRAVYVARAA